MVDWSLARQIARFAAGGPIASGSSSTSTRLPRRRSARCPPTAGSSSRGPAPPVHEVERREWAEANLTALAELLDPVGERLDERLGRAGPLAGALKAATGATLAAEVGLVMGYMSQRVLGQYELSLLQPEVPPRLLFVTPNLRRAVHDLDVDEESFLRWVVLHEVTHVAPVLRRHVAPRAPRRAAARVPRHGRGPDRARCRRRAARRCRIHP